MTSLLILSSNKDPLLCAHIALDSWIWDRFT